MARIELSNIGGGTTLSLTTTGTSGAATLAGPVLNIPVYQGQLTLTTTGTSGAATLVGNTLNIPQYSGGGTPAGSTGEIQYNNAGAFGASSNLAWNNTATQLNIGAPSAPTGKLNVKGGGSSSSTANLLLTNSGNTQLFSVLDNGFISIGSVSPVAPLHIKGIGSSTDVIVEQRTSTSSGNNVYAIGSGQTTAGANNTSLNFVVAGPGSNSVTQGPTFLMRGNSFSQFANERGAIFFYSGGGMTSPSGLDGAVIFGSYSTFIDFQTGTALSSKMRISNAGDIGIGSTSPSARLHTRGSNASSGTNALLVQNSNPDDIYKIENNGKISYLATNTAAGTTGAQTINRPSGTVNFAAGASALVVTNSLCTTASLVFAEVRTNDATAQIKNVVPAAGSFTINLSAAATAETSVGFFIIN